MNSEKDLQVVRGRIRVDENVACERVDIAVDEDYGIPSFVYSPLQHPDQRMPGLVWNGGWPQDKWDKSIQRMAVRMARRGFVVVTFDHAPFGETTPPMDRVRAGMTLVMGMGHVLGWSQPSGSRGSGPRPSCGGKTRGCRPMSIPSVLGEDRLSQDHPAAAIPPGNGRLNRGG